MTEAFLQYIWKHRLFDSENLKTVEGQKITVHSTGQHNTDSGPDFFDARLTIGDTLWAGNVEVHVNSSDWLAHGHQHDKAYNNVILHVVANHNGDVKQTDGLEICTVVLSFPKQLQNNYQRLLDAETWIPCEHQVAEVDSFMIRYWLGQLAVIRLERKTIYTERILQRNVNNWEETFYQQLARSFGFSVNADPFEQLAISLPQNILAKNKGNQISIEALLFGQAGFLDEDAPLPDAYYQELQNEYIFLRKKYNLNPLQRHQWKFMRLRPVNFPTVRIAQFAGLIYRSQQMFSKVREAESVEELKEIFQQQPSSYWETHYNFFKESVTKSKTIGKTSIQSILINTVVPILFAFGKHKEEAKYRERALRFLEEIESETNHIVKKWKKLGIKTRSASDTQALIELKSMYCDGKKCLACPIGNKLVNS